MTSEATVTLSVKEHNRLKHALESLSQRNTELLEMLEEQRKKWEAELVATEQAIQNLQPHEPRVPVVSSIGFTDAQQYKIVGDILRERHQQDVQWGGPEHEPIVWLKLIKDQNLRSGVALLTNMPDKYRERLVKIAALAMAIIESHDRKAGE